MGQDMRIGFTGAHGTGKTTTAQRLVQILPQNWPMVPSTARLSQAAGFPINRDATPESQLFTMMARTSLEDKVEREYGRVVSDRTPLDSLAYTKYQLDYMWKDRDLQFYYDMSYEHTLSHMQKYDAVFYFPVLWSPVDDGVRDPSVEYQLEHNRILVRLAIHQATQLIRVPDGTVDERAQFIKNLLTGL
jgi:hypothetical protein